MSEKIDLGNGKPEEEMVEHANILNLVPRPTPDAPEFEKKQADGFWIDDSKWRMREYKEWIAASKEADLDTMARLMVMLVKKWPYKLEIVASSFDELHVSEWAGLVKRVSEAVTASFR